MGKASSAVTLRRFPYPFRSMLAISSDIDSTRISAFRMIHRFMNTLEETPMGPGVGLDISDSMWLYRRWSPSPSDTLHDEMTYFAGADWTQKSTVADELIAYARAGWIDTLHSYGDFSMPAKLSGGFTRRHAEEAIRVLKAHDLRLPIWVDHGNNNNTQNLTVPEFGKGNDPASNSYHFDLLSEYGCHFISTANVGTFGSAAPLSQLELGGGRKRWGFERTGFREGVRDGELHALRHGLPFASQRRRKFRKIEERLWVWVSPGLHLQFTDELLSEAADKGNFVVAAQHLGCCYPGVGLDPDTVAGFRRLAAFQAQGKVLVARTSRLLEYARVSRHLQFDTRSQDGNTIIDIRAVADPVLGTTPPTLEDVRGVTFYVKAPARTRLLLNGTEIPSNLVRHNPSDGTGRSIGIAWHGADHRDHTAAFSHRPDVMHVRPELPEATAKEHPDWETLFERLRWRGLAGAPWTFASIGVEDGRLPAAIAALNQPDGDVVCFERDPRLREAARENARRLGVVDSVSFFDGEEIETAFTGIAARLSVLTDGVQQFDPEAVFEAISRTSKTAYVRYRGLGSYLTELAAALDEKRMDRCVALIRALYANELYLHGLGAGVSLRVFDQLALLRIARAFTWRILASPGELGGTNLFPNLDGEYDFLLQGRAGGNAYAMEAVFPADRDFGPITRFIHLIEGNCPRLALAKLDVERTKEEIKAEGVLPEIDIASARVLAHLKMGVSADPGFLEQASDGFLAMKAKALVLHSLGRNAEADAAYQALEGDASVPFLRAALLMKGGEHRKAAAAFRSMLRKRKDSPSLVGYLAALERLEDWPAMTAALTRFRNVRGTRQSEGSATARHGIALLSPQWNRGSAILGRISHAVKRLRGPRKLRN